MSRRITTLAECLAALPASELREILRARAATLKTVPRARTRRELVDAIGGVLGNAASVLAALELTDLAQLEVLVYVIAHGRATPYSELERVVGPGYSRQLRQAVEGLQRLALAFTVDDNGTPCVSVPPEVSGRLRLPPSLLQSMERELRDARPDVFKRICDTVGVPLNGRPVSAPAVDALVARLTDRDGLLRLLGELPERTRELLNSIAHDGGLVNRYSAADWLDARQRSQLFAYDWPRTWFQGKPRNPVEVLMAHGFLFPGRENDGYLVMPRELWFLVSDRDWFGPGISGPPRWEARAVGRGEITAHTGMLRDVACFLAFVDRGTVQRTGKGVIHRNVLKAAARTLTVPAVEYADFVYVLCREMGLIGVGDNGSHYDVRAAGHQWLALSPADQVRALVNTWLDQRMWHEDEAAPVAVSPSAEYASQRRRVRAAAADGLRALHQEHPGAVTSIETLASRAFHANWSVQNVDGPRVSGETFVPTAVGNIVRRSLYWLGLAEVGPGAADPHYARLSPLGRSLLAGEAEPHDILAHSQTFTVQANLEVFAPPNLSPALVFRLGRLSEPSANGVFTLTRDSLRQAMDLGEKATDVLSFLSGHSSSGVPQNVEYLVKDVGARHGHIRVGQAGLYLHVDDPVLIQELVVNKKIGIKFREQLTDTVALIAGDSRDRVLAQLRDAGYYPVSVSDQPRPAPPRARASAPALRIDLRLTQAAGDEVETRINWAAILAEDARKRV